MAHSPRILHLAWGVLDIEGLGKGRDFKLWPGGGRPWDWSETGTHHDPGIQPADVEELLEHGAEIVILTRGMHLVLKTMPETEDYLRQRGVACEILETREAGDRYNALAAEGRRVGGLFHSTC
ncbi:MAG: Mth938-like domain-containing protein [Sumerlaeia bacterium]